MITSNPSKLQTYVPEYLQKLYSFKLLLQISN